MAHRPVMEMFLSREELDIRRSGTLPPSPLQLSHKEQNGGIRGFPIASPVTTQHCGTFGEKCAGVSSPDKPHVVPTAGATVRSV